MNSQKQKPEQDDNEYNVEFKFKLAGHTRRTINITGLIAAGVAILEVIRRIIIAFG